MNRFFFYCLLVFALASGTVETNFAAAEARTDSLGLLKKNIFRFELFGPGLFYSVAYERMLLQREGWSFPARLGVGFLWERAQQDNNFNRWRGYSALLTLGGLYGKGKMKLELGPWFEWDESAYRGIDTQAGTTYYYFNFGPLVGCRYFFSRMMQAGLTAYPFYQLGRSPDNTNTRDYGLAAGLSVGIGF